MPHLIPVELHVGMELASGVSVKTAVDPGNIRKEQILIYEKLKSITRFHVVCSLTALLTDGSLDCHTSISLAFLIIHDDLIECLIEEITLHSKHHFFVLHDCLY